MLRMRELELELEVQRLAAHVRELELQMQAHKMARATIRVAEAEGARWCARGFAFGGPGRGSHVSSACVIRFSFDAESKVSTWLIEEFDVQQGCNGHIEASAAALVPLPVLVGGVDSDRTCYHNGS